MEADSRIGVVAVESTTGFAPVQNNEQSQKPLSPITVSSVGALSGP
jgi:hypothetical protein